MDFLIRENLTGEVFWVHKYVLSITELGGLESEVAITGTFYHPVHGFVTISTPSPFVMNTTQEWPTSGILLCEGAGNTSATLIVNDEFSYTIEVDRDGDDVIDEVLGPFLWTDL